MKNTPNQTQGNSKESIDSTNLGYGTSADKRSIPFIKKKRNKKHIKDITNLGFGTSTSTQGTRFMDKNGEFLIRREGIPFFEIFDAYHWLITMPWMKFIYFVIGYYVVINFIFATVYFTIGTETLEGSRAHTLSEHFLEAFFFSSQTLTTVGYGSISPRGIVTQTVAATEAFVGILTIALVTGLLYGRFARPVARLMFSYNAVVAPFKEGRGFMFRVANKKNNLISEAHAQVTLGRNEIVNGASVRKFYRLKLEYDRVNFLTIGWTINHPVDDESPLYGITREQFEESDAEFLVLVDAFDNTFSQNVHTTYSYKWNEFLWGEKFEPMYERDENSEFTLLRLDKIGSTSPKPLPDLSETEPITLSPTEE